MPVANVFVRERTNGWSHAGLMEWGLSWFVVHLELFAIFTWTSGWLVDGISADAAYFGALFFNGIWPRARFYARMCLPKWMASL